MKILFLSQRVPYPPNRGDKITTWRLIERLRRQHELRVIAFAHDAGDERAAAELRAMGFDTRTFRYRDTAAKLRALPLLLTSRPLTLGVYGSRELQAAVDEAAGWADLAYAYSSSMGAFLEPHAHLPRVMHFGELDSDKWRQYAQGARGPLAWVWAREQRTLLEFERRIARSFSMNVLCTPLERRIFEQQIPGAPAMVVRNGVDLEHFSPAGAAPEPGHLVFTGVMNYRPNAQGCEWFVHEILPLLRQRVPAARLSIVGAHPTRAVKQLARAGEVEVTGFVDDTRDWLRRAQVAVAPLRIARGIQNKVLEALAMGLPLVGTTCATQGVGAQDGTHLLVRDEEQPFADALAGLLEDPAAAAALGRRGRAFVEQHCDWERALAPLDDLVRRLGP